MCAIDLPFFQLKATYNSIKGYYNASGFHFDNVNGANIEGETAESIWNDTVTKKVFHYQTTIVL